MPGECRSPTPLHMFNEVSVLHSSLTAIDFALECPLPTSCLGSIRVPSFAQVIFLAQRLFSEVCIFLVAILITKQSQILVLKSKIRSHIEHHYKVEGVHNLDHFYVVVCSCSQLMVSLSERSSGICNLQEKH